MTSEEIIKALGPWLARVRRMAWKPVVEEGDGPGAASKFGGVPWTQWDAPWPHCGWCNHPLPLFLQLDLDRLPEAMGGAFGSGLLQLFYCMREECQGSGGWDPFDHTLGRVRVIRPRNEWAASPPATAHQLPAKRIVRWDPIDDLPSPEESEECGFTSSYDFDDGLVRFECPEVDLDVQIPIDQVAVEELVESQTGDKLGGWPAWGQGVEYPYCPRCGRRMILVFQLDSEDNIPFMFGDAGCGHITQCPEHKDVVAFGWACS